ncbi:winged helix-turn-helix transcriptional regulator [Pseudooceanicola sp. LIPI14-2-Ac024]|uniref:winged helix-turn-helix transcriptional regulator n=1 Tax=Pseudooceanicola sp. LIPI14-2-Ac024 TaxID=3344875 RepID=UPI0035D078AC
MKRYGQFCPIAKAAEVFCTRWTPLILRDLAGGATRFSDLQRGVPLASPSVLSARLKELEAEGIVERHKSPSGRSWTYHLTPAGADFAPIVLALGTWGQHWSRRDLAEDEMDLDLLLWAMEKNCDPRAFGAGRTVVELGLTDQPAHKARWWFLNEAGRCELCVHDPGFEVDLYLASDLATLIYIWRGEVTLTAARGDGRIEVDGSRPARDALARWLRPGPLADVPSLRAAARG